MTFKQTLQKAGNKLAKHSPAIFTGIGIAGLGATAYLAYKSREKVENVVEELEMDRELGRPVDKVRVVRDMTEALYQPVLVGAASITCILMAHKIQHKRILTLAGALAVEQSRNIYFEQKYKREHGEEAYAKFVVPTEQTDVVEVGANGKEKVTTTDHKSELDKSIGQWYNDSTEYARDDHSYNLELIRAVEDKMQTVLFQRGSLTLNEVREALCFERIRAGALLGWTTADVFSIDRHVSNIGKEELGESLEQIWVTWTHPRYIYDQVEFNGRYSHN